VTTYRIIPVRRGYRVEGVQPNGETRAVRTWPTEDAAVSHLRALRQKAEIVDRPLQSGEQDWAAEALTFQSTPAVSAAT
jgi:hypothetical protein